VDALQRQRDVLIDGKPTSRLSGSALRQLRSRVGFVFQQFNLYAHLTGICCAFSSSPTWRSSASARS
jgi:polar amino acid transport system ATP-binding protein